MLAPSAAAMVFQTSRWLDAWYSTIGRVVGQPLLVTILDRTSGELAAMLPLVLRTDGGFRTIEFADATVSDYNAPVLGPAAPTDRYERATALVGGAGGLAQRRLFALRENAEGS